MTDAVDIDRKYLLPLRSLTRRDAYRTGAKATNVAALHQAGFSVPDGLVLTTDAFAHFLAANTIASEGAPEGIVAAPLPTDVAGALQAAAAMLGDTPLAVRSSAVAEDLPDASFAGQYETVLNVRGEQELEAAVRRCWASAFSEHVVAYRQRRGIEAGLMAVLIQQLVPADAAGVAFTADPVTGDRGTVVINAVAGLGERLVSGEATPDEWTVRGERVVCRSVAEGALTEAQARAVAAAARRVESRFGAPMDIEWAIAGSRIELLQARPITALPEPRTPPSTSFSPTPSLPVPAEQVPPGYWVRNADHAPQPNSPMHDSWFLPRARIFSRSMFEMFAPLIEGIEFRSIGGWEYIRMVPAGGREGPPLPTWLMWLLVRLIPSMRRRIGRTVAAMRSDEAGRLIRRWYDRWQPDLEARIAELRDVELTRLSDSALDDHLEIVGPLFGETGEVHVLLHGALAVILFDLVRTCRDLLGWSETQAFELVNGTSFRSTEPSRRLNDLAQLARANPALQAFLEDPGDRPEDRLVEVDEAFAEAFAEYMRTYGCRGLSYDVIDPTLAETPALVLQLIRGQIVRDYEPAASEAVQSRKRAEAAAAARDALAGRSEALDRFERVLERAERAYPVREDNEFFTVSAPIALLRYALLEVGARLADRGIIERRDDVFFLELTEARSALFEGGDRREQVERRQRERARAATTPGPPSYGPEPGPLPPLHFLPAEARTAMESVLWSFDLAEEVDAMRTSQSGANMAGTPVSAGVYTGAVRVIRHEGEFGKLQPGDVLVCPTTSPVWSVLFPSIGALVTDSGGILSHPAIIAREYGVPAVVALGNATSLLSDGQIVTVDGAAGTVTRARRGDPPVPAPV